MTIRFLAFAMLALFHSAAMAHTGPFDGKNFTGRIAFSFDGNFNDEDDWGAFPIAAAILDAFDVTDKLVHVDYNNILVKNDPRFYREMTLSVAGCIERFGIRKSVLYDCQKDLDGAVESIKNAINASSASNPLYYVLAGPMEVPFRGIEKSDPLKRKYVYCISHSNWNDGYTRNEQSLHRHNKRDVIPSGINWIQIKDGNSKLAHPGGVGKVSTPQQWLLYRWLKDSQDARLRWIYTRLVSERRCDISDATMTYFLLTGDEDADLAKLRNLLDRKQRPTIAPHRSSMRLEAENFIKLDNYEVAYGDRRASHRLYAKPANQDGGSLKTPFLQPYAAPRGLYSVGIRYRVPEASQSELTLLVDGDEEGESWKTDSNTSGWATHSISDVTLSSGDELEVRVEAAKGSPVEIDYVELTYTGRAPE